MLTNRHPQEVFTAVGRTFPQLRELLQEELAMAHHILTDALDGDTFRRQQGRAQLLRDLIKRLTPPNT